MPVLNRNIHQEIIEEGFIPITRPYKWGNPFIIGKDGTREEVLKKYRKWLWKEIKSGRITLEELASLYRCQLVCVCVPMFDCHGEILEAAAEWAYKKLNNKG